MVFMVSWRLDKQRQTMHAWISSSFFDSFIGFIIFVNAVIIGYATRSHPTIDISGGIDEKSGLFSCFPPFVKLL